MDWNEMKIGRNTKCLCGSGKKYKNCCLSKPSVSSADKTAMVVGAGAVENAWAPVLRALQPYHDFPLTGDGANSFLARLIYLLRWWASNQTELGRNELLKHKDFLAEIRNKICEELRLAQENKEIGVRNDFTEIVDSLLLRHSKTFMLITTNWDCVVEHALSAYLNSNGSSKVIPLHIHGSIEDANTIYLPTEMRDGEMGSDQVNLLIFQVLSQTNLSITVYRAIFTGKISAITYSLSFI